MRFLFLLPVVLFACSGHSVPRGVLPPEKMEAVFYDIIRADELVEFRRMIADSTYNQFGYRTALYDTVFQLHSVKKETFQKSLRFYQGRPDLLKEIFDGLQKRSSDTTHRNRPLLRPKGSALQ